MWRAALLALACLANASIPRLNVLATSFDLDAHAPPGVIGHFNLTNATSSVLTPDISPFPNWADVIEASIMGPWEYMLLTAEGDVPYVSVYNISAGTLHGPVALTGDANEVHCTPTLCYGLDLNRGEVVQFDPRAPKPRTTPLFSIGSAWDGLETDASALDREHLVLYATLSASATNRPHLVALDLQRKTLTVIAGPFAAQTGGPYCFDATLGLVSLGNALGGIVAMNVTDHQPGVLRPGPLGGLPGSMSLDCQGGVVVMALIDFHRARSPTILVAFDFFSAVDVPPFHNSTTDPDGVQAVKIAAPPVRD